MGREGNNTKVLIDTEVNELIIMKKSRKKPKRGDVFVVQPKENLFYYGKVIDIDLVSKDSFINGMVLIYIYNRSDYLKQVPTQWAELFMPPLVINFQPWLKGYIETIGNSPVTEEELKLDFGFYDLLRKQYVNINGDQLAYEPLYTSIFGLGSYGVLKKEFKKRLN